MEGTTIILGLIISGLAIIIFFSLRQRKYQRLRMGFKPVDEFSTRSGGCLAWIFILVVIGYLFWFLFNELF